jgi:glycosyltransferase involved in cell wall biosynthesis
MGKAVVSTTVGAEGLPVTSGQNIVIADEPARFAQAVVHMIRDVESRRRIEAEARRLVVEKYDWSAVAQDFENALARLRSGPGPADIEQEPELAAAGG